MKRSIRWRRKLQRHLRTAKKMLGSLGYFQHRGVRVFHPGILIDQPKVAEIIDASVAAIEGHSPRAKIKPVLEKITLRYSPRPILTSAGWVAQDARWTGGLAFLDRGVAKIHYDDEWQKRTRNAIIALVLMELQADPAVLEASDSDEPVEEVSIH